MLTWDYKDKVTYWEVGSIDGFGSKTFNAPVLLDARWENRAERFISLAGEEEISRAVVWVKQTVDLTGYLYLGDGTATADPTQLDGAYEIRMIFEIPDLRKLFTERRAFL